MRAVDDADRQIVDSLRDLHRVIIATPGSTDTDRGLIIAHGTFDEARIQKKADETAKDDPDVLKVHKVALGLLLFYFGSR